MSRILIVTDMQNDFIRELHEVEQVSFVSKVRNKIQEYIDTEDRVWIIKESRERGNTVGKTDKCIIYTLGWNTVKNLYVQSNSICLFNRYADSYRMFVNMVETELQGNEEKGTPVDEIQIVGMNTASSIVTTAIVLKTLFPSIRITVDERCCICASTNEHNAGIVTLRASNINII